MGRKLQIVLGNDHDWLKASLDELANDVIEPAEVADGEKKLDVMIRAIAAAGIANMGETTRLLKAIKELCGGTDVLPDALRLRWSEPTGDVAAGDNWENIDTLADYLEQTGRDDFAIVHDGRGIAAVYASDDAMGAAVDLLAADAARDEARHR